VQIVINSIKQTLLYSGKSIKEIAIEYHFPSQSFFGKYFKQYTGMSPREFREDAKAKYLSTSRQDNK
ncbi:MAG: helix-turn-helix domain-containing protein, partial [Paraprevotella sp.]|nr:helix-turn-helix domain-containing protein [Paraprevotella sp.]